MNNLVIIPARGGSKGIPNKNIKEIAGKPLIGWTIESALNSSVDRVVVSTDCSEIARVSRLYGASAPFLRPVELATDSASTESAVEHALDWLRLNEEYIPDNIILLQCTSPVRNKNSIDEAISQFNRSECDSLLSACEFWHFLWSGIEDPVALYDYKNRPRRQDIAEDSMRFKENGSIYITSLERFRESKNRLSGKISIFKMTEEESFEIDSPLDWLIVESILNSRT